MPTASPEQILRIPGAAPGTGRLSVAADEAAVDPRLVQLHGHVVDQVTHLEVVGAVEDQIGVLGQFEDVGPIDVGDDRLDVNRRVDGREFSRGGLGLGQVLGDVLLVEEHLPLQVGRFDEVAIDDADMADAGANQGVGQHGAEGAARRTR